MSGGTVFDGLRISVGNPHLACLVDAPLDKFDLSAPPELDPGQFPAGANLELVQLTGPGVARDAGARARIRRDTVLRDRRPWQPLPLPAAATDAGYRGGTSGSESWQVRVPGGELTVTLDGSTSWLTGPAVIVAEGELNPGLARRRAALAASQRVLKLRGTLRLLEGLQDSPGTSGPLVTGGVAAPGVARNHALIVAARPCWHFRAHRRERGA